MPEPKIKQLALKNIEADASLQMRAKGLAEAVVDEYAAAMNAEAEFPPLVVYHDPTGTNWLSQGFHRHAAALKAGLKTITVEMRSGNRKDALIDAAGSNATHGMRRTNADKRRAAGQMLTEFTDMPDEQIADIIGVSGHFVGVVRKRLSNPKSPIESANTGQIDKDKNDKPDTDDPLGGVEVSSASAEKCVAVCTSIIKLLHRSQEMVSALMASPYASILRNVSQSVTGGELYATGETVKKGELHGVISFGWPAFSNQSLDDLLQLCGSMKLALARADEIAAESSGEQMTSAEVADFAASLRNPEDTVKI